MKKHTPNAIINDDFTNKFKYLIIHDKIKHTSQFVMKAIVFFFYRRPQKVSILSPSSN